MTQPPQTPQPGYGAPLPPYPGTPAPPQNAPTPSIGQPGPGGASFAPPPPAPPKRRTGLIVTVILVAVVLLTGGGFLAVSLLGGDDDTSARQGQGQSQEHGKGQGQGNDQAQGQGQDQGQDTPKQPGKLTTPKVVKSTPAELRYDARATTQMFPPEKRNPASYPELKSLTQVDSVYHPKNDPSVTLTVHTGAGTVPNPAQRVTAAFAPNEMAVGPKTFGLQDPAAKGAVLRCGVSKGDGAYIPLCVWADGTSVGDVIGVGNATSSSLKKVDLKTLVQQTIDLRKAMHSGSTG